MKYDGIPSNVSSFPIDLFVILRLNEKKLKKTMKVFIRPNDVLKQE